MKRKLILLCALLIMFLPALKVDATAVSDTIAKKTPVKSTKYESSGLNYIMYLQIPKSLLGDYEYDESQGRYPRKRSVEWLLFQCDKQCPYGDQKSD